MSGPLPADLDDNHGCADGHAADCAGYRRRCRSQTSAWRCRRRGAFLFPDRDPVPDSCCLHLLGKGTASDGSVARAKTGIQVGSVFASVPNWPLTCWKIRTEFCEWTPRSRAPERDGQLLIANNRSEEHTS